MFADSRCFPDEVIFNRHLADVRVLSGHGTARVNILVVTMIFLRNITVSSFIVWIHL